MYSIIIKNYFLLEPEEDPEEIEKKNLKLKLNHWSHFVDQSRIFEYIILKNFNKSIDRCGFSQKLLRCCFDLAKFTCDGIERCQNSIRL